MNSFMRQTSLAVIAGLAVLSGASAQGPANVGRPLPGINPFFQVSPGLTIAQQAFNTALLARANATVPQFPFNPFATGAIPTGVAPGVNPGIFATPFGASMAASPYGAGAGSAYGNDPYSSYSPYGESAIGGYLRGAADLVSSTGKFQINLQQANLLREQVQREKIDNRRRVFDQWLYEREKGPTWEQERQRYLKEVTNRSKNDPPSTEIWSASALNFILADIQKKLANDKNVQGPQIAVDEEVLRHINLTSGKGDGNAGLLRTEGRLNWPLTLKGEEFQKDRVSIDGLAQDVFTQAVNGRVDAVTLKDLMDGVGKMRNQLVASINELPPSQYMEAKRFLSNFDAALRVLRQPDAGDYFTQKYAAKGKNVAELVKYLTEKGLRFAPAVDGDEAAYIALHRALVAYDAGANAQLAAEKETPGQ
jgi:hypothetical protein